MCSVELSCVEAEARSNSPFLRIFVYSLPDHQFRVIAAYLQYFMDIVISFILYKTERAVLSDPKLPYILNR